MPGIAWLFAFLPLVAFIYCILPIRFPSNFFALPRRIDCLWGAVKYERISAGNLQVGFYGGELVCCV